MGNQVTVAVNLLKYESCNTSLPWRCSLATARLVFAEPQGPPLPLTDPISSSQFTVSQLNRPLSEIPLSLFIFKLPVHCFFGGASVSFAKKTKTKQTQKCKPNQKTKSFSSLPSSFHDNHHLPATLRITSRPLRAVLAIFFFQVTGKSCWPNPDCDK